MTATYPQFQVQSRDKRAGGTKTRIRLGYISAFCSWHTVGKLFLGWVQHHDRKVFEVYVYHVGHKVDFLTAAFEAASARFVHLADCGLTEICERIVADSLDILVYFECGMRPLITKIAALRLAPIQCVTWGHPVTSGLPTIDYFLSSEMMEPPEGDEHYSETLVRLPNIGVCVPQPLKSMSTKTRADYGLSQDCTIYVYPHSLFKQLPQYDYVFPAIVKENPRSEFLFFERETHSIEAADAFRMRVGEAFIRNGLDANKYVRVIPQQDFDDFLGVLSLSDVCLDSIGWSGGMTTLECMGCMLPVVTMPGHLMRGRHAYGCLNRVGIQETLAQNPNEYVNVAVRLGLDQSWKQAILLRQANDGHLLYNDKECLVELEKFYIMVARP
jgi:predicted O-linked N-acetylglucosamine transferase (SPINDLY family)